MFCAYAIKMILFKTCHLRSQKNLFAKSQWELSNVQSKVGSTTFDGVQRWMRMDT